MTADRATTGPPVRATWARACFWAAGLTALGVAAVWGWLAALPAGAVTTAAVFSRVAVVVCGLIGLIGLGLGPRRARAARSTAAAIRLRATGLAVAVVGALLASLSIPPLPPPVGVPLVRGLAFGGQRIPVLVVPQRAGWNLVHVDADEAAVGLDPSHLTAGVRQVGSTGMWALIRLPAGHVTLRVLHGGELASLPLVTGHGDATVPGLVGPDGPECASAALGALIGGAHAILRTCPDQAMTSADGPALRGMVRFIADRGIRHITLITDSSPRSAQAARQVRAASGQAGVTVGTPRDPGGPVVIVSDWPTADRTLAEVAANRLPSEGTYLAPWLLDAPLLEHSAGQLIPLRFDPHDTSTVRYIGELNDRFPGEVATESGYDAWLAARGSNQTAALHLYAASLVYDPGEGGHSGAPEPAWLPGGTVDDVSAPLNGR